MTPSAPIVAYPALACAVLLTVSNLFMTFAWYGHLKHLQAKPWWIAALVSWGIALFEYLLQVPANRIGYTSLSLAQLKILQEVITLAVFVPFAVLYMGEPVKLDYLWAGAVPDGRRLLHLPRVALVRSASRAARVRPAVHGVRGRLPAVVPLPHGQRGHLARADARPRRSLPARWAFSPARISSRSRSMQIPVGMLLDRYGPRRVEPMLLAVAAAGALLFAVAEGLPGLALGRAIIGAGVASCLMAPLKGIAMWYPVEKQASLAGWMMVSGGVGALAATTPIEIALRFGTWREIFVVLAALTLGVAVWLWFRVPDIARHAPTAGFAAQWAGVQGGVRPPALLVDRAARGLRHGRLHGGAGPVGGAVDDGGRGHDARARPPPTCSR